MDKISLRILMKLIYCIMLLSILKPFTSFRVVIKSSVLSTFRFFCHKNEDVESIVVDFMKSSCLVQNGDYLLLSVSGGSDSMCLLHIMQNIKNLWNPPLRVEVVNFNHKLRPEADHEASFVSSISAGYEIPFYSRSLPEKNRVGNGLQATARIWRRSESLKILKEVANSALPYKANMFIATAHHKDDQVETLMLKLLRGVHISRLYPMLPIYGKFIKPLLSLRKQDIETYMKNGGHSWCEDSSNSERKYKRNAVRLDLVPTLKALAGGEKALYR